MHRIFPGAFTAQKVMFSIEGFFSKFDAGKLEIWSHLLKKSLVQNFIFVQCLFPVNGKEPRITWEICKSNSMTSLIDSNKFNLLLRDYRP